jgi:uncharacterized membrane protein YgcG
MDVVLVLLVLAVVVVGGAMWLRQRGVARKQAELEDAKAEARRWVERLGGQVLNLVGSNEAAQQALADAGERYNAAGSQLEQAKTPAQAKLVTQTALEGLYYTRAARVAMDLDPGPELPEAAGQSRAGAVSETREVDVEGHTYAASPQPSDHTPHYYPGGMVAGRPVPRGWYSEPWWKPALVAGAWGVGSFLLFSALFSGMHGVPMDAGHGDGDTGGDGGEGADSGDGGQDFADSGGDYGGGDYGGGDVGGGMDFGGGDFGGF